MTETMVTTERRETTTTTRAPGQIITIKATDLGTWITIGRVTTVRGGRDGLTTDTARDMRRDMRRDMKGDMRGDMTTVTGKGRDVSTALRERTGEKTGERTGKKTRGWTGGSMTEGKITTK